MVQTELEDSCHVTETKSLIDQFFPIEESVVDRVYTQVIATGAYIPDTQSWSSKEREKRIVILRPICRGCGIHQECFSRHRQPAAKLPLHVD